MILPPPDSLEKWWRELWAGQGMGGEPIEPYWRRPPDARAVWAALKHFTAQDARQAEKAWINGGDVRGLSLTDVYAREFVQMARDGLRELLQFCKETGLRPIAAPVWMREPGITDGMAYIIAAPMGEPPPPHEVHMIGANGDVVRIVGVGRKADAQA